MAQKRKRRVTPRKGSPSANKNRIPQPIVAQKRVDKVGTRTSTRGRAFQVRSDMLRDPSLSLAQAARNRNIDPRTVRKQVPSIFYKDSSDRIRPRTNDRLHETLYIPTTRPGERIPARTKGSSERRLLGRWMEALNAAGRGDFSKIRAFPSGQFVGGVRLPTSTYEVQRILNALAEEESPYEGLYRTIARPS